MVDILQDFPIQATPGRVFRAVSGPEGLDQWWTLRAGGEPSLGAIYELVFGEGYHWSARISRYVPDTEIEFEMGETDADWAGTRVGFHLTRRGTSTWVRFHHTGWAAANEHYRISAHCWALYLRVLRRYLEHGEVVAYGDRLGV